MIQLKKINPSTYMRGTKAMRFQVYLWLGLVGFCAAVSTPLIYYFHIKARPDLEEKMRQKDEAERLKLQQIAQIYEAQHQQNAASKSSMGQ